MAQKAKEYSSKARTRKIRIRRKDPRVAPRRGVRPATSRSEASGTRREIALTSYQTVEQITPEKRWNLIALAAYYRAEKRGFVGGDPKQDWWEAEAEVDAELARGAEWVR